VSYYWRTDEFEDRKFSSGRQIGVIAQEVEEVLLKLVFTDNDGYKSVAYANLTAILIEAVKELNAEKNAQSKQIAALEERLGKLESGTSGSNMRLSSLGLPIFGGLLIAGFLMQARIRRRQ